MSLFYMISVQGQNLLKNSGFEHFAQCPGHLGNFDVDLQYWSTPSQGTTDYFHGCSKAMGVPGNFNGTQEPWEGQGYAGLYLYAPDDYREYVQGELSEPLREGERYQLTLYLSLAERSDRAVEKIGLLFTNVQLRFPLKTELSKGRLYKERANRYHWLEISNPDFYTDTRDWQKLQIEFIAKGTERFLILGNFEKNARTRTLKRTRQARLGAYYYIDGLELTSMAALEPQVIASVSNSPERDFEMNKPHVFGNVLFEFDRYVLLENAKAELRRVFDHLMADDGLQIKVSGYTDALGLPGYNRRLSHRRAQAVATYLIGLGLPAERVRYEGHGGDHPIADNDTESGRRMNRRVEFMISRRP